MTLVCIGFQPCTACPDQDGTLIMPIVAILWQQGAFLRFPAEVPVMSLTPLPLGCIAATLLPQPLDPLIPTLSLKCWEINMPALPQMKSIQHAFFSTSTARLANSARKVEPTAPATFPKASR